MSNARHQKLQKYECILTSEKLYPRLNQAAKFEIKIGQIQCQWHSHKIQEEQSSFIVTWIRRGDGKVINIHRTSLNLNFSNDSPDSGNDRYLPETMMTYLRSHFLLVPNRYQSGCSIGLISA